MNKIFYKKKKTQMLHIQYVNEIRIYALINLSSEFTNSIFVFYVSIDIFFFFQMTFLDDNSDDADDADVDDDAC